MKFHHLTWPQHSEQLQEVQPMMAALQRSVTHSRAIAYAGTAYPPPSG